MWWHLLRMFYSFILNFKFLGCFFFFLKGRNFATKYAIFRKMCHLLVIFCKIKKRLELLVNYLCIFVFFLHIKKTINTKTYIRPNKTTNPKLWHAHTTIFRTIQSDTYLYIFLYVFCRQKMVYRMYTVEPGAQARSIHKRALRCAAVRLLRCRKLAQSTPRSIHLRRCATIRIFPCTHYRVCSARVEIREFRKLAELPISHFGALKLGSSPSCSRASSKQQ